MSLFGSPPDRARGASSGIFGDDDAPQRSSSGGGSGLFDDNIENERHNHGQENDHPANLGVPDPGPDATEQHSQTLPMNKPSFVADDPASDPWGTSPVQTKTSHTATNGFQSRQTTERTTSAYSVASDGLSEDIHGGGFGASTTSAPPPAPRARPPRSDNEEVLSVATIPEKEGMFLFQHRNYEVSSNKRSSSVIRRYSDFVWLLECLHKRYPFRQLPLLPPKRVSINGNHLAADNSFIEKRRRGLSRFANALLRHPVLKEEQLVTMFLTVPTELAAWRKQASISVQEEFVGRALPPTLEDSLPDSLEDLFSTVRAGVSRSAEAYINLCSLMERVLKRREGLENEYGRLSTNLKTFCEASNDTFNIDTNDVPLMNVGVNSMADHLSAHQNLMVTESQSWDTGVLEDFKRQRDCLVSMRDMFQRRDLYAKDNIPTLERRITSNEDKLMKLRAKPESARKPGDAQKIEESIIKDKESIVNQHARGVFIKECVRDEIRNFQSLQYDIGLSHQDWMADQVKAAEQQTDNWRTCADQVENMPTTSA